MNTNQVKYTAANISKFQLVMKPTETSTVL